MKCEKCNGNFSEVIWKSGEIYEGLDEHHNPPQYMKETWTGKLYDLCRKHHKELHNNIILPILQNNSILLKKSYSEQHNWKFVPKEKRINVMNEVITKTEEWLHGNT